MADIVRIQRIRPDLWTVGPPGAPTTADTDPGVDTAVLEVAGGHLRWRLTTGQRVAAAVLYDLDTAQEWLWALYGAEVALAADAYTGPVDLPARPGNSELAAAVRRLGYAHWAARWWPASTIDGIAALDPSLLHGEIVELTRYCESVVDGADSDADIGAEEDEPTGGRGAGEAAAGGSPNRSASRADDYALAAGRGASGPGTALVLDRGATGWDWRRCPTGVVDASERAVSWELLRVAGSTVIRVHVAADPGVTAELPGYLRPHALIRTPAGLLDVALELSGDTWTGEGGEPVDSVLGIDVYVPGVGADAPAAGNMVAPGRRPAADRPDTADPGEVGENTVEQHISTGSVGPDDRRAVRELARSRLRTAAIWSGAVGEPSVTGDSAAGPLAEIAPLRAEIAAATQDPDF